METINNIAGAASKAIWGTNEANEEPVSGVKGNTNQGEPYDAGNIDSLNKEKKTNVADAQTSDSATASTATTTTGPSTTTAPNQSTPAAGTTGTGTGNEHSLTDRSRATEEASTHKATEESAEHKDDIGKPELKHTSPDDVPSADSAAGKTETRAPSDPATDPAPKGQDVDNKASGPTSGGDKLDGPGPRPLEAVARERGGDAGNVEGSAKGGLIGEDGPKPDAEEKKEDDPNASQGEEGTGEKLVKATGLAADGGDFDATKPGAGREADRLLDEKDPAHAAAKASAKTGGDKASDKISEGQTHSSSPGAEKEKESLKDKIKAKLHRH
ncbi:hypothetical protein CORC01_04133 [Colletotrichum orchidophilum]|uniref:Glycine-rich cell wall structural protein 1 n=1 Tax=Colletotrichum orchidophilum TaxID=1209926 RepID=A0A1G4BGT3_9PEZI|nr:uncharacterized protein CORC01_04133 [Colletotrichum orchidophilum]OHF00594.1 hypothetical protein CORC01_04133 [Colletotrichum orchidophilum]